MVAWWRGGVMERVEEGSGSGGLTCQDLTDLPTVARGHPRACAPNAHQNGLNREKLIDTIRAIGFGLSLRAEPFASAMSMEIWLDRLRSNVVLRAAPDESAAGDCARSSCSRKGYSHPSLASHLSFCRHFGAGRGLVLQHVEADGGSLEPI